MKYLKTYNTHEDYLSGLHESLDISWCERKDVHFQNVSILDNNCILIKFKITNSLTIKIIDQSVIDNFLKISIINPTYQNILTNDGTYTFNKIGIYAIKYELNDPGTSIPNNCFKDCINIVDVKLSDNINTIGSYAFSGCINLMHINLDNIDIYGDYVFDGCYRLKGNLEISNNCTYIGDYAFKDCIKFDDYNLNDAQINFPIYPFSNWNHVNQTIDTNQFFKRTTANGLQLLNDKALLKGIRGNTCRWEQKIALDTTGSIYLISMTEIERDAEHAKFSISNTLATNGYPRFSFFGFNTNNVYYIQADVYVDTDSTLSPRFDIGFTSTNNSVSGASSVTNREANKWIRISKRITVGSYKCLMFCVTNANGWANDGEIHDIIIKNYIAVNLTALFGAGKEPTSAQFRELFGLDYYKYNGGLILNNSMTNYVSKRVDAVGVEPEASYNSSWFLNSSKSTLSKENGIYTYTYPSGETQVVIRCIVNTISGHKYYARAWFKSPSGQARFTSNGGNGAAYLRLFNLAHDGTWEKRSCLRDNDTRIDIGIQGGTAGDTIQIKYPLLIDLTVMFGSGKEPTIEICDSIFDQWEIPTANIFDNWNLLENIPIGVRSLTSFEYQCPYDSQVEYIDDNSIDTSRFILDYVPNGTDIVIKTKIRLYGYGNTAAYSTIIGSYTSGGNQFRLARYNNSTTQVCGQIATGSYGDAIPFSLNTDHIVELSYGKTIIDGIEYANATAAAATVNSDKVNIMSIGYGRVYYLQIYKAGNLVADVIPVRVGNDAWFYDKISNKLCTKGLFTENSNWTIGQDTETKKIKLFPNGLKSTFALPNATPAYLYKSDSTTSYFNLNYVPTGQDIVIKAKIRFTSYVASSGNLIWFKAGAGSTGASTSKNWYAIVRGTANSNIIGLCGNRSDTTVLSSVSSGNDYEFELSYGNVKINGTDHAMNTTIGLENESSLTVLNGINGYIYYLQVYKGEDLVIDCIPYRDSTQVALYDRARNILIKPTYEGSFSSYEPTYDEIPEPIYDEIKQDEKGIWKAYRRVGTQRTNNTPNSGRGEYVPLAQEEVYVLDDQSIPNKLTVANQGIEKILPYDAEVEWLESNGNEYIDLGEKANQNTTIEVEFYCVEATSARIFGARTTYSENAFMVAFTSTTNLKFAFNYDNISNTSDLIFDIYTNDGNWHTAKSNGNGHRQIDNITKTGGHSDFTTPYNVLLFGYNDNGTARCGKVRIRRCKFNSLDLIPVRKDGVGYMYDKVSGQLFGNSGSGKFTYGNDIATIPTAAPAIMEISYGPTL